MFWRCVNLPRWGLKHQSKANILHSKDQCKFTPLGFETNANSIISQNRPCVNLPRWGLKRSFSKSFTSALACVNLPRWGLKHDVYAG